MLLIFFICLLAGIAATLAEESQEDWSIAISKVDSKISLYHRKHIDVNQRVLVIYHIGDVESTTNSIEVATNNLKIFLASVERHSQTSAIKAFYLFNVIDPDNILARLIPNSKLNVATILWENSRSDLDTHLETIRILGENVTSQFSTVLFGNQGVRGPLVRRENGDWIGDFTRSLQQNNVGMVGPSISCEIAPHVQTHMFALRTSLIPTILAEMKKKMETKYKRWQDLIASLEVGLTELVTNAGYNISSFLHQANGQPYFQKCLQYTGTPHILDINPTGWCDLAPEKLVFIKWGGELLRTAGLVCNTTFFQMENSLEIIARKEPELQLAVPEALRGGKMLDVFSNYAKEAWIDRHPVLLPVSPSSPDMNSAAVPAAAVAAAVAVPGSKVCFLVRVTQPLHAHRRYENSYSPLINKELELLITTLRRQSNPNWLAMIYRIDNKPTHGEIASLISSFDDPRLEFDETETNPVGSEYSSQDAGYTVTDKYLKRALQRPECQWISVTTSDNAYGSEVVQNILCESSGADYIYNPVDSRRFQQRDIVQRNATYCSFLSHLKIDGLTYATEPKATGGQLDLAVAFLRRDKLLQENIFFGDFSDRSKFPCVDTAEDSTDPPGYLCLNAQGAHLLHHLSSPSSSSLRHSSRWTLARLPVDGLKSVVFHGNSPTLCIGAGNTWLDHPDPAQRRCMTGRDIFDYIVNPRLQEFRFDAKHFKRQGQIIGMCMRLQKVVKKVPSSAPSATKRVKMQE